MSDTVPNSDNDKELTPEQAEAQEQLQMYKQALEEEYAEQGAKAPNIDGTAEEIIVQSAELILAATPKAFLRIVYLVDHAESESVQLSAAKYIAAMAQLYAAKEGGQNSDPVQKLIDSLTTSNT